MYYGQTAGWIKMPLGTEVGLGPGRIVLWGPSSVPPPKKKGAQPPIFGPCLLWPNGWMDQDATWYGGRPGDIALDGDSAPHKGAHTPNFRPVSIVTKRSPISATAEHLFVLLFSQQQGCSRESEIVFVSYLFAIN